MGSHMSASRDQSFFVTASMDITCCCTWVTRSPFTVAFGRFGFAELTKAAISAAFCMSASIAAFLSVAFPRNPFANAALMYFFTAE